MSSTKKNNPVPENTKGSTSSRLAPPLTSTAGVKRTLDEEPSDGPEDWTGVLRRVFVTRDTGVFRHTVERKEPLFTIVGHFADDKVVAVQVWGKHAERISKFFSNASAASADGEVVWIVDPPNSDGACFRLTSDLKPIMRNSYGADFCLTLNCVTQDLPKSVFPCLYAWTSDPYVLDKGSSNERPLPHYTVWGKTAAVEEDDVPITRTFQQASPKKAVRAPVVYAGKSSRCGPSELSFDE